MCSAGEQFGPLVRTTPKSSALSRAKLAVVALICCLSGGGILAVFIRSAGNLGLPASGGVRWLLVAVVSVLILGIAYCGYFAIRKRRQIRIEFYLNGLVFGDHDSMRLVKYDDLARFDLFAFGDETIEIQEFAAKVVDRLISISLNTLIAIYMGPEYVLAACSGKPKEPEYATFIISVAGGPAYQWLITRSDHETLAAVFARHQKSPPTLP